LSALIIACALAGPVFAETTRESTINPPTRATASVRSHHRSHVARHVARHTRSHAKPSARAATKVSGFRLKHDPDYPWVLPA
jgi:hypothetical protein